jgi:hypothetical protein
LNARLQDLGLTEGPLDARAIDPAQCSLPASAAPRALTLSLDGRSASAWTPEPDLTPVTNCVCFKAPAPPVPECTRWKPPIAIPLPETAGTAWFALTLGPTTALVGVNDHGSRFYQIALGPELTTPEVTPVVVDRPINILSALAAGDGSFWLGAVREDNQLATVIYRARLAGTTLSSTVVLTSSLTTSIKWMDGTPTAPVPHFHFMGENGVWIGGELGRLRMLHQFPIDQVKGDVPTASLLWLGDDETLAVAETDPSIYRYKNDAVTSEPVGSGREGLRALAKTPLGPVVGSSTGSFYLDRSAALGHPRWEPLGHTGLSGNDGVRSIAAYEDGFVFAGYNGYVGQYRPGAGVGCLAMLGQGDQRWVTVFGDDLLIGGDTADTAEHQIVLTLLRRQR